MVLLAECCYLHSTIGTDASKYESSAGTCDVNFVQGRVISGKLTIFSESYEATHAKGRICALFLLAHGCTPALWSPRKVSVDFSLEQECTFAMCRMFAARFTKDAKGFVTYCTLVGCDVQVSMR